MGEIIGLENALALVGGVFAGFLNTLASSGSAVTLPLLVFLGLTPNVANATNRIGIVTGAATSTWMFFKDGLIKPKPALKICLPAWLGAIVGAVIATRVTDRETQLTIFFAVALAFVLVLVGAKRFLKTPVAPPKDPNLRDSLLLCAVGVWAGYIVLDSATYLLLTLVLCLNLDLKQANAYKSIALLGIALFSVLVFWGNHQINWSCGFALALGNILGAWAGAKCAILPNANKWVYRLLVTVVSLELLKMIFDFTKG